MSQHHWRETHFIAEQAEGCALLDNILEIYRPKIGDAYTPYRGHCQRVYAFTIYLISQPPSSENEATQIFEKIAIASAFHDIGLWTAYTVDYLVPSNDEAMKYLDRHLTENHPHISEYRRDISLMITRHHQFLQGSLITNSLPDLFRRADLVDFSWGWVRDRVPTSFVVKMQTTYPNAGFHLYLVRRLCEWVVQHPFNPIPMMRLTG